MLLLSYHLHLLNEGNELWLYLITAIKDTPLANAILDAARQRGTLGTIEVAPPKDRKTLSDLTEELPDSSLPANFYELRWERQAVLCALEVRRWAREWGQSASVLVLVPGAAEMGRLHAEWLSTPQTRNQKRIVVTVSSDTPQGERQRIRSMLDSQQCDRRYHSVLVIATSVFEASVTLDVNGVVGTGLAAERDFDDFLAAGVAQWRAKHAAQRQSWAHQMVIVQDVAAAGLRQVPASSFISHAKERPTVCTLRCRLLGKWNSPSSESAQPMPPIAILN